MEKIQITGGFIKLDALLKFANLVSSGGEAQDSYRGGRGTGQWGRVYDARQKAASGRHGRTGRQAVVQIDGA